MAQIPEEPRSKILLNLALGFLVLLGLVLFLIPAYIIRPFRYQSPRALSLAMAVHDAAPLWTFALALLALAVAFFAWGRVRTWGRLFLVAGVLLSVGSAVISRLDYFEWMFHPIPAAGFETATQTKLDPSEMVMTVRFGDDARAYPIRQMAYHHVLNDVVAGTPIAVTY